MANLQEYENEYYGHVQAAQEKLALAESSGMGVDAGRSACGAAERATEAARDVVQLMELEGRSLAGAPRAKLQERIRGCRDEVASLKARVKNVRAAARGGTPQSAAKEDRIREECFAGSDRYRDETAERSRMLSNNERISKATDRLNAAHSVTLDMENTANSILGDLSRQRETLNHARGTLRFAADGLDKSKRLLGAMARRAAMNKLTLYVVIALLVGMLLLLAWPFGESKPSYAEQSPDWKVIHGSSDELPTMAG